MFDLRIQQHYIILFLCFLFWFTSSIEIRHITFNMAVMDKKLTNHEIAYHTVESRDVCMEACFFEPFCVSINYYPNRAARYDNCELSSSDSYLCPDDMFDSKGTVYLSIQNQCHDVNCPDQNMTCLSGFTSKGYKCVAPLCYEGPLGMEDGRIPDSSITASSEYGKGYLAKLGRLRSKGRKVLWASKTKTAGEYLQVDLGHKMVITKVATQGNGKDPNTEWVTKYYIAYSQDNDHWQNYTTNGTLKTFPGNINGFAVVTNTFDSFIKARHVRIVALEFYGHISLRAELYGCKLP